MAVELATGYVSLAVSTRDMSKGVDKAGKDAGKRYGVNFGKVAKGLIGAAALVGGGVAAVGFLKDANAEARESQKVGAVTAAQIKATGGVAKVTAGQVGALAEAISRKTGIDDEAIQAGSNLILSFKNVHNEAGKGGAIFDRATQSAVDLSKAGFGSLSSTSKTLGKALNDPIKGVTALRKVGVTFTDQQKKQIETLTKSGDVLGAQKVILKAVEGRVGGVAAASATMGDKAKVAFDNFKESVGKSLLPVVDKLFKFIVNTGIPTLGLLKDSLAPVGRIVGRVFKSFIGSLTGGKHSFKDFSDFIRTHQSDIVGGFVTFGKGAIQFGLVLAKVISVGLRGFGALADGISTLVSGSIDNMYVLVHAAAVAFAWVPGLGDKLKDVDAKFADFGKNAQDNIHKTGDAARKMADGIDGKLTPALEAAGKSLDKVSKKELIKAKMRDAVAKAAIAIRDLGTKADGSQIHMKRFADRTKLSSDAQRALHDRLKGARDGLRDQLGAMRDAGAGQRKLSDAWKTGKDRLYDEFRQMGLSKAEAKKLALQYAGIKPKVETKVTQPGMKDARKQTKGFDDDINALNNKSVSIKVSYSANGKITVGSIKDRKLANLKAATGGVLPGFTPGRDVHRFTSSTGGALELSGGEAIMRPEWTRAIGGPKAVAQMNAAARSGKMQRFAGGGIFRKIRVEGQGNTPPDVGGSYRSAVNDVTARAVSSARSEGKRLARAEVARQKKIIAAAASNGGGDPGGPAVGGGRGHVGWKGGTFTERFRNTLIRAQRLAGTGIPVFQGGFSHRVRASGTSHYGDAIDTQWNSRILSGLRRARVAAWHRTPAQGFPHHIHGVPLPGAGFPGGSGGWQAQDYLRGGNGLYRGTNHATPGLHWVGERGPELLSFKGGEKVINNKQSMAMAGSGATVNQYFPSSANPQAAASAAGQRAVAALNSRGW